MLQTANSQTKRTALSFVLLIVTLYFFLHLAESLNPLWDGLLREAEDGPIEAIMHPPFRANHSSFLNSLPTGDLLMAWFSGSAEGYSDVAIVLSRLVQGSNKWTQTEVLTHREHYSNQNPVIHYNDRNNTVHLYFTQQLESLNGDEGNAMIWEMISNDLGHTWSQPKVVLADEGTYIKNRIITGTNDSSRWLFPAYFASKKFRRQYSMIFMSNDYGETWDKVVMPGTQFLVQPALVRIPQDSSIVAFFRDRHEHNIYISKSIDDGYTWTIPVPTELPNNNAAIQAIRLESGALAMVFNNVTKGRDNLVVGLSLDNGESWPYIRTLERGVGRSGNDSVSKPRWIFCYPSIVQDPSGAIHVSMSYRNLTIKYMRITEEWIKQADRDGATSLPSETGNQETKQKPSARNGGKTCSNEKRK
eukprot:TRINITY_DN1425_c0_g1_i2.p1 TRINITY_DN1425_c0_g1~~TRINITY_DN1425_c0_g1_i2.p1  ORF type:complete len:417 (+),score=49.32 TRINITY_DN1425_c0_g1_i2:49-1299(+)